MFEYDICVDLPDVLDGKPDYANAPLSKFITMACVDRLEVLEGKPSYANSLFPKFFTRARCPPCPSTLWSHSSQGVWLRGRESSNIIFQTFLFLPLSSVFFFFCFMFFFLQSV